MRTKIFNLFTLIINSMLIVASVASISMMIVYEKFTAFATFSMYVTLLVLVSSAIGMHYNIKSFKASKPVESKWYLILRLSSVTTAILNCIMAIVFIRTGAGILDKAYLITRIIIPFLMLISILFTDIGKKTPFVGICFAPIYITLFLVISFSIYGSGIVEPPYEYLSADTNSWVVSLLMILCLAAASILLSSALIGLNYAMHYAVVGKFEKQEKLEKERLEKEAEEVKELEEEAELKEALEDEVEADENAYEENIKNLELEKELGREEEIFDQYDIAAKKEDVDNENVFLEEPEGLVKSKEKQEIDELNLRPMGRVKSKQEKKKKPAKKAKKKPSEPTSKVYHISRHKGTGKWQVKAEGASRALKLFNLQQDAIDYAKSICINSEGSSIKIHALNGKIRKG